jgi:AraC-like DNA-binding protein
VDFNPIHIKTNTLLFLNKDTLHFFDPKGDFEAKSILFTDNFFCKTEADIKFLRSTILFNDLFGASQVQLMETTPIFENLMHMMKNELENNPEVFHQDVLKNYLHTFLMLAERERRKQKVTELRKGADFDYTLLFKDLLEAGYRQVKQVSSYASQLSVTKKRLNQATTRVLGKSPKNIIDERVILEAKRLLVHTHENIKEIGYVLGFQDPAYFIKFFRKHCGITPVAFREQVLG